MHYEELVPDGPAAAFVDRVWRLEHGDGRGVPPQEVLPDGSMEFVFHLGDAFEQQAGGDRWVTQDRVLAAGQLEGPLVLRATGVMHVIGIRFRPGGARGLLPLPQHELTGRIVPLREVAPSARRLSDVIEMAPPATRLRALVEALTAMARDWSVDPRLAEALGLIRRSHGRVSVDAIASRCNLSGRQLERRFRDDVGLPPKRLARIVRFQRALRILSAPSAGGRGADLAAGLGYADQAHFIRDFREFAGHTPMQHPALESALTTLFTTGESRVARR
jgi:AraC-like DNA-binding protein